MAGPYLASLPLLLCAPAYGQDYDRLFTAILAKPDDPALNKAFARQAEARGDVRLAFAAIERIVTSSPGDTEAQAEYDRLRNKLLPAVTRVTVEVGASYTSNPTHQPSSALRRDDATFDIGVAVADERTLGGVRWRTKAVARGQLQAEVSGLDHGLTAVETGPVFFLRPNLWMHVAAGGAVAWLDGQRLFNDASAGVTFGGLYGGLTQTVTARYTYRDGNFSDTGANDAHIVDLEGRFVTSPSLVRGDLFYVMPRVQLSEADGNTVVSTFIDFVRPLFPGDYIDVGGRIAYYFPIGRGRMFVGAGIAVHERWYDERVSNLVDFDATGDRRDFYIEPTAHLVFPNLIAPALDLRFDYRFEGNYSNDAARDYENHVAGARVVGRF